MQINILMFIKLKQRSSPRSPLVVTNALPPVPQGLSEQCCGMIFSSKGFKGATQAKGAALEAALLKASEGGKLPIVVDTSPCLAQIKGDLTDGSLKCAPGDSGSRVHLPLPRADQGRPHRRRCCMLK